MKNTNRNQLTISMWSKILTSCARQWLRVTPLLFASIVIPGVAQASCRALPSCPACATSLEEYNGAQVITIDGGDLSSTSASKVGTDLAFSGDATALLIYGPYFSQSGSKVRITPTLEYSTHWRPGDYETCHRRDWRNRCVGWGTHENDSGFTIDYAVEMGSVFWAQVFHQPHVNHGRFMLPTVECDGALDRFEVRIHSGYAGTVDFAVHKLELDARWRD